MYNEFMIFRCVTLLFIISFGIHAECPKVMGHFSYQKRVAGTSKIKRFHETELLKRSWEANDEAYSKLSVSDNLLKKVDISINNKQAKTFNISKGFIQNFSFKDHVLGKPKPFSIKFKFNKKCQHTIQIRKGD